MCTTHVCHIALDNANLHTLETRSSELFNIVSINYYFGGYFFFHDLRNSNKCNFKQLIFCMTSNTNGLKVIILTKVAAFWKIMFKI